MRQWFGSSLRLFVALASVLGFAQVWAQELVSIKNAGVPLREQASADAPVLWELSKGYPLQVLERKGEWIKVQDFEGDQGWVAKSTTDSTPHHVVRVRSANLRGGPGTDYPVVGGVVYGQVLTTQWRQDKWVRIQRDSGQVAWVSRELLWGW